MTEPYGLLEKARSGIEAKPSQFNILYSSVQTQEPAIYNSTPIPDIRRRFGDDDPIGKVASQILERGNISIMDQYDFDAVMQAAVHDAVLPGRGTAIVVYDPTINDYDEVVGEELYCEPVQWDDFLHGPAKRWAEVPWIAIRYRITREEAIKLNPEKGGTVDLDYVQSETEPKDVPSVFKRLTIWKIWDKSRRQIVFIAPSYKEGPFATEPDRLRLKDFFPMPRPMYDVFDSSTLVPVVPFDQWKDQADELNVITRRIKKLTQVLRWRGIRPAHIEEFDRLKDADDGDLVPSESWDALAMTQGTNPDRAIWIMPIDKLILVIRELVQQREIVKQVVFEISGLADIMRGETNPNETLGAQQIKAQWGSLRMQHRQREAQRFARDLIRIQTEIMGEHFADDSLAKVSGINLPTAEQKQSAQFAIAQGQRLGQQVPPQVQQIASVPSWDDVRKVIASDELRSYRIDIETDSTIQHDVIRQQGQIAQFTQGMAQFMQSMAPAIQSGDMPKDIAADLLIAFARTFKLGRQAEDALERWGKLAKQPQQPKPNPQVIKAQQDAQLQARQQQMDAQNSQHQQMREDQVAMHNAQMDQRTQDREDAKTVADVMFKTQGNA